MTVVANVTPFPPVLAFPSPISHADAGDQRCAFARQRDRWILLGDCELSSALDLPAGVTLDGGGHTITLTGNAEGFESAAIRVVGGNVSNLTVDGSQLRSPAPAYFTAIALTAPASATRIAVRNIRFDGAPHSAIGIEIAAFDSATALVQDVAVENISGAGLLLTGNSQATVERMRSTGVTSAVQVTGATSVRLREAVVEDAEVGVLAQDRSCVRLDGLGQAGERVAEDQARIHEDSLIFIGGGDRARDRHGASAATMPSNRLG